METSDDSDIPSKVKIGQLYQLTSLRLLKTQLQNLNHLHWKIINEKENLNSHVAFVRKVLTKIINQFTVIIVTFGFTKSVRVFQMMNFRS